MQISVAQYTLYDVMLMLERKELIINENYQRASGIWPDDARSYFIDTILEGYLFPRIYLYQTLNKKTNRPIKELVDGQQRITTIRDFINNKFILNSSSKNFQGLKFEDLTEEQQNKFRLYLIETTLILNAGRNELFELFRRMNAYTSPLTKSELRHSIYQGEFKWLVIELADEITPILEEYKILTVKQIARMADTEFLAELILVLDVGITSRNLSAIDKLYKKFNDEFENKNLYKSIVIEFFDFLNLILPELKNTYIVKSYVIYSLFCAYVCKKNYITEFSCTTTFLSTDKIIDNLKKLSSAHELGEEDGIYSKYVKSSLTSTVSISHRKQRTEVLIQALEESF